MPETVPPQEPMIVRMPLVRLVPDGERIVFQVVGSTLTPPGTINGRYLGANGYVTDIADAVNVRGPVGGSASGTQGQKGDPGTDGKSAYTLWLEAGNSGTVAVFLASLKGMKGDSGQSGRDGTDGLSAQLQVTSTAIQWRLAGGTWADLVQLSALKGANGIDGKSVELQKTGTAIQWRTTGGTWADIVQLADIKGVKGDTGDAGQTLLRQINITETATIAITMGTFEKQYACVGAVVGERYAAYIRSYKLNGAASATAGRPAGYWIVAIDCLAADTVNVVYQRPAISLTIPASKYELFTDIVKVNAS